MVLSSRLVRFGLARWAARLQAWSLGRQVEDARRASPDPWRSRARRDVFCYFDNDIKVHAPYDASHLMANLGLPTLLGERGQVSWPPDWETSDPYPRR